MTTSNRTVLKEEGSVSQYFCPLWNECASLLKGWSCPNGMCSHCQGNQAMCLLIGICPGCSTKHKKEFASLQQLWVPRHTLYHNLHFKKTVGAIGCKMYEKEDWRSLKMPTELVEMLNLLVWLEKRHCPHL